MIETLRKRFANLRASAPFWSLRYVDSTQEVLAVRQDTLEPPQTRSDRGAMLTVVVDGGMGYCGTSDLSVAGLQAALDRAAASADLARRASLFSLDPASMPIARGERPALGEPVTVSRSELYDLLADECRAARIDARIVERYASLELRNVEQLYLTNSRSDVHQQFRYTVPYARVTANHGPETLSRSFERAVQGGLEVVGASGPSTPASPTHRTGFIGSGRRLADEALRLLAAPNCPSGRMDLLLMPDQMMLQIHESIGHPLELDRILGDERNYAGTSFVTRDMFGSYQYGSPLLNVTYDPTIGDELASFSFDDDGSQAEKVWLIRNGILERPLGGQLSQLRAGMQGTANSRATSWNRAPIDRMANLNVEPGSSSLEEMIASIEHGVLMRTNTSWSIDDSRNKFQFGCEWGEVIQDGRVTGAVKHPNYRGISAEFWRSLRMVGNRDTFEVHGTLTCGKGEPNQAIHVGHAAPACVFGDVEVFGGES